MPAKSHGGARRKSGRKPARSKKVTVAVQLTPAAAAYLDTLGTRMGVASAIITYALGELGYEFSADEAMRFAGIADRIEAKQKRDRENVFAALGKHDPLDPWAHMHAEGLAQSERENPLNHSARNGE